MPENYFGYLEREEQTPQGADPYFGYLSQEPETPAPSLGTFDVPFSRPLQDITRAAREIPRIPGRFKEATEAGFASMAETIAGYTARIGQSIRELGELPVERGVLHPAEPLSFATRKIGGSIENIAKYAEEAMAFGRRERQREAAEEKPPAGMTGDLFSDLADYPLTTIAQALPEAVGSLVSSVVAYGTGGIPGLLTLGASEQYTRSRGEGEDRATAMLESAAVAPAIAAFERIPLSRILGKSTAQGFLARLADLSVTSGVEGGTEFLQGLTSEAGAVIRDIAQGDREPEAIFDVFSRDSLRRAAEGGFMGVLAGGVGGIPRIAGAAPVAEETDVTMLPRERLATLMSPGNREFALENLSRGTLGSPDAPIPIEPLRMDMADRGWDPSQPLTLQVTEDGYAGIMGGHHRLLLAEQLGIDEIPVRVETVPAERRQPWHKKVDSAFLPMETTPFAEPAISPEEATVEAQRASDVAAEEAESLLEGAPEQVLEDREIQEAAERSEGRLTADEIRTMSRREGIDLIEDPEERLIEARISRRTGELDPSLMTTEEQRQDLSPEQAVAAFRRGSLPFDLLTAREQTLVGPEEVPAEPLGQELEEILETPGEPGPAAPVMRPGPPIRHGERLRRNRIRLRAIRDRLVDEPRLPLSEELRGEVGQLLEEITVPRRERALLTRQLNAGTHKQGLKAVRRILKLQEDEMRVRARKHLQDLARRLVPAKVRPEFMSKLSIRPDEIDFSAMSPKTRKLLTSAADYLEREMAERKADLEDENVFPQEILPTKMLRKVARLDKTSAVKMDVDELWELANEFQHALHVSKYKNRLIGSRRGELIAQTVDEITEEVRENAPELPRVKSPERGDLPGRRKPKTLFDVAVVWMASPEKAIRYVSEKLHELTFQDLRVEGGHKMKQLYYRLRDPLEAKVEELTGSPMGTRGFRDWILSPVKVQAQGKTVELTRGEVVSILGSLKDPYLRAGLMGGRPLSLQNAPGIEFRFTPEQLGNLARSTDEETRALADFLFQQYNGDNAEILDGAYLENFGRTLTLPNYFPSKVDADFRITGQDPLQIMGQMQQAAMTSWGHTKERTGTKAALTIGNAVDQYVSHIQNTSRIAAYLAPVRNLSSVLGRPEMKKELKARVGDYFYERLLGSIRLETTPVMDRTTEERGVRRVFQKMAPIGYLGLRMTVPLLNLANVTVAAAQQDGGFRSLLTHGLDPVRDLTQGQLAEKLALIYEHSPSLRSRYDNFLHHETGGFGRMRRSYGRQTAADIAMYPATLSDKLFTVMRWGMAEDWVQRNHPDLEQGSEPYFDEVARQTERLTMLSESHPGGGGLSGFLALGRGNAIMGLWTAFSNAPTKVYSLGVEGVLDMKRARREGGLETEEGRELYRSGMRKMSATVASAWIAGGIYAALRHLERGEEEDEEFWETVWKETLEEGVSLVPFVGDALLAPTVRYFTGRGVFTFPQDLMGSAIEDGVGLMLSLGRITQKALTTKLTADGEKDFEKDLTRLMDSVSGLLALRGIPAAGGIDLAKMVVNVGRKLLPKDEVEVFKKELRPEPEDTEERGQSRAWIMRGLREEDDKTFRRALVRYKNAYGIEGKIPFSRITGVVRGRFPGTAAYDPESSAYDEEKLAALSPLAREGADVEVAQKHYELGVAEEMAKRNPDLVEMPYRDPFATLDRIFQGAGGR